MDIKDKIKILKIKEKVDRSIEKAKRQATNDGITFNEQKISSVIDSLVKKFGITRQQYDTIESLIELEDKNLDSELNKELENADVIEEIKPLLKKNIFRLGIVESKLKKIENSHDSWEDIAGKPEFFSEIDADRIIDEKTKNIDNAIVRVNSSITEHEYKINILLRDVDSYTKRVGSLEDSVTNLDIPINHSDLKDIGPDDHHKEKHTLESHLDSSFKKKLEWVVSDNFISSLHQFILGNTGVKTIDIAGITKNDADLMYLGITSSIPIKLPSIIGQSLKALRVKSDESGLEFFTGSGLIDWGEIGGTITDQTDLTTYLSTNYVPYTGANADVNLGSYLLTSGGLISSYVAPSADSTTAFQIRKADKTTSVLSVDTTNGRVGIGTTSPNAKLESLSTTEQFRLSYDTTYYSKFIVNSTGGLTFTPSANSTNAYNFTNAAGDSVLNINTSGGRVGINTNAPTTRFHVAGTEALSMGQFDVGINLKQVTAPAAPTLALVAGAGNVDTGQHYYKITYVTALGETGAPNATAITTNTTTNGQVTVTLPVATDYRVTGRKIYRTKAGEHVSLDYLLATISNNTDTSYTDNTADASLTGSSMAAYFRGNTTNNQIQIDGQTQLFLDRNVIKIGIGAGEALTTGGRSVFTGYSSGRVVQTGRDNNAYGMNSLFFNVDGSSNNAFGYGALYFGTGSSNTAMGHDALYYQGSGGSNSAFGNFALSGLGASAANYDYSTAIGASAGYSNTGSYNTYLGGAAGYSASSGTNNIYIGHSAGYKQTTNSNMLIVDSIRRATAAVEETNAIIYGKTATTPDSQTLRLNAKVGINVTPTALLNLAAGTATANTAPLKFTSGPLLTAHEDGTIQYLSNKFYITGTEGLAFGASTEYIASLNAGYLDLNANTGIRFNKAPRTTTSLYRRYYHIPLAATNPGSSGATWVSPGANTTGGWNLTSATNILEGQTDVHSDWDGASDPKFEVRFATNVDNTGGAVGDTVDLKLVLYYKDVGDTATKTQTVEVATVIGQSARYKQFKVTFPVNYDESSNVLDAGDIIGFKLNLETDTSEVDNIILSDMSFSYLTNHTYIEDGDE